MHILVTNDDGVTAPGLLALAQEMNNLGRVSILAPDRNWSASGHVKTLDRPLRVKEVQLTDSNQSLGQRWCALGLCGPGDLRLPG